MHTHADKTQENKNQLAAIIVPQKMSSGKSSFQFVDNRPEAIAQRKLQEMANKSPQIKQAAQLQTMANNRSTQEQSIQKKENNTGLPDIESLSEIDISDVKVHYNSNKPAKLNAPAYAQGTDIHLASGQEKHLPHEAWHVVKQKQELVKPTMQMKGIININDNVGLEKEVDAMGSKAVKMLKYNSKIEKKPIFNSSELGMKPIQRMLVLADDVSQKEFGEEPKKSLQNYLSESSVIPMISADFANLTDAEHLHIWGHAGSSGVGHFSVSELASELLKRKFRTAKSIRIVGCNEKDNYDELPQKLSIELFNSLSKEENKLGVKQRIPVYATKGPMHNWGGEHGGWLITPFSEDFVKLREKHFKDTVTERRRLEGEANERIEQFKIYGEKCPMLFKPYNDTDKKRDVLSGLAKLRTSQLLEEKQLNHDLGKKQWQELLLPPDERGRRQLNPLAWTSYTAGRPIGEDLLPFWDEAEKLGNTDLADYAKVYFSVFNYIIRKDLQYSRELKEQFGSEIQKLYTLRKFEVIRLGADIQRWVTEKETGRSIEPEGYLADPKSEGSSFC